MEVLVRVGDVVEGAIEAMSEGCQRQEQGHLEF